MQWNAGIGSIKAMMFLWRMHHNYMNLSQVVARSIELCLPLKYSGYALCVTVMFCRYPSLSGICVLKH